MATEFEKSIGWNGPDLETLIGRDLTVRERQQDRRGPIIDVDARLITAFAEPFSWIQFRVAWVALKENGYWRLEHESQDPEKGTVALGINLDHTIPHEEYGEIILGKGTMHRLRDNIAKPEIPSERPANYIFGTAS